MANIPKNGKFSIIREPGLMQEEYTITAENWTDDAENYPLRYDYYQGDQLLASNVYETTFKTKLIGNGLTNIYGVAKN